MTHRSVVISGMGVLAPNAVGRERFWRAVLEGRSGIRVLRQVESQGLPTRIGGEVDGIPVPDGVDPARFERLGRFVQLALSASVMAVRDSGLVVDDASREKIGVCIGTGVGGVATCEKQRDAIRGSRRKRVNPFVTFGGISIGAAAAEVAKVLRVLGPLDVVSTGCASAASAIALGFDKIRWGAADAMIVGGTEAPLTEVMISSFAGLNQTSRRNGEPERASRPFDRERDGFVLSEGSGILVLEEEEHARRREATIYARVLGHGQSHAGLGSFDSERTSDGVVAAMRQALSHSGVDAEEVDYIGAQGSSGRVADRKESEAIRRTFGRKAFDMPVSSIKSLIGHPLGASAVFQVASSAMALSEQVVPPTWNYEHQDPDCDLDYVPNAPRLVPLRHAMVNSFAVGGLNVSLMLQGA